MNAMIHVPICPLQSQPDLHSELVDEALYGMVVKIVETVDSQWCKVETHYRYEGYAPTSCLLVDDRALQIWNCQPKKVVLHKRWCDVMLEPKVQSWPKISLPLGSQIVPLGEPEDGWQKVMLCDAREGYIRDSHLGPYYAEPPTDNEDELRKLIVENALRYKNTQYRWGGKSPQGIDCSGLVSMAYLLAGIIIYRDASIKEDFPIHPTTMEGIKPADLIFFPGHVAMYLGDSRYVHSTGKAGDDGFAINSLDPSAPDYRADLADSITTVGTYF